MNNKKDKIYVTVIALCAIVALALLISFWIDKKAQKNIVIEETPIATLKPKEDKVKITVNTQIIQDGLNDMGFLVTQEYYFTQVEEYTKSKKIFKVLNSESGFTYSYDGSVTAGIEFGNIKVTRDDDEKTITVEMPKSKIQTVIVDKNTFRVYSEKESIWNSLKIEDYNLSLQEFEDAAKEKAIDSGILDRSDEQAQKLIENFISNFPLASDYDIRFIWRNDNES